MDTIIPADVDQTRSAYDDVAVVYTELFKDILATMPFDRAMLAAFADLVRANGGGPVADIGCGPGRITAHLAKLELDPFGIDLSLRMIELARQAYPQLRFDTGSMESLAIDDAKLAGIVAWYSLIHLPPERVPGVLTEFYRVLEPGGYALLGFFAADASDAVEAFDHKVTRAYRWSPQRLSGLLDAAGFATVAQLVRRPEDGERFLQGSLLVVKDR
ncbi:class I SAM-dependent methyltransferase [Nocardia australiensis]|uniref:class I SAM-dependent methyltransferase n=1 Tax=Nocardia australiensis TaxID=2887191 RepID=UPI001D15A755|nr:class I SAM-dependent methyltransferase [Nocardia australiensis]